MKFEILGKINYYENFRPLVDDGTRLVRIVGCEYRLSESEILNWLTIFGEVLSEITEEPFDDSCQDPTLSPVGNGTYIVGMKLIRDLPNWVPMYGKKVCLDYRGISKNNVILMIT